MSQILVIEDNPVTLEIVVELLTRRGHRCVTANNGGAGLDRFCENKVDLVITDIIMPEREGLETIMAIRRTNTSVPIIAMSGSLSPLNVVSSVDYLRIAAALGANERLHKPFSPAQFYEALDRLLPVTLASAALAKSPEFQPLECAS